MFELIIVHVRVRIYIISKSVLQGQLLFENNHSFHCM